jgi:hypothetical protein
MVALEFLIYFYKQFKSFSFYVSQAGLELTLILPQPPECWDYRCATPCLAQVLSNNTAVLHVEYKYLSMTTYS